MKWAILILLFCSQAHAASPFLAPQDYGRLSTSVKSIEEPITIATGTVVAVEGSTVAIRGAGGEIVTAETNGAKIGLNVVAINSPNLSGRSFTYSVQNSMVVGSTATITGLGKTVDLQALGGDCVFTIDGGEPIIVSNTLSEVFDLGYIILSPEVHLVSKTGGNCRVRITGAL